MGERESEEGLLFNPSMKKDFPLFSLASLSLSTLLGLPSPTVYISSSAEGV